MTEVGLSSDLLTSNPKIFPLTVVLTRTPLIASDRKTNWNWIKEKKIHIAWTEFMNKVCLLYSPRDVESVHHWRLLSPMWTSLPASLPLSWPFPGLYSQNHKPSRKGGVIFPKRLNENLGFDSHWTISVARDGIYCWPSLTRARPPGTQTLRWSQHHSNFIGRGWWNGSSQEENHSTLPVERWIHLGWQKQQVSTHVYSFYCMDGTRLSIPLPDWRQPFSKTESCLPSTATSSSSSQPKLSFKLF